MILDWLGIPSDRTDLLILLGVTLGASILSLFFTLIFESHKHPSQKIWSAFFIVSLLLFGTEIYTLKSSDDIPTAAQIAEKKGKENNNVEASSQEVIDTSVTYADIFREFKRNELAAKDLYNGNRYQITAQIIDISTSGFSNLLGGATLTMQARVDNTIVYFEADFNRDQEENLKKISVGDTITFIGTCYKADFSNCELQ